MVLSTYSDKKVYLGFGLLFGLTLLLALSTDMWYLFALPFVGITAIYGFLRPIHFYYLLFALLPFSLEVNVAGGFGTDLPSEPLMLLVTGLTILLYIQNFRDWSILLFSCTVTWVLAAMLLWIGLTSMTSEVPIISIKYLLAKLWYILPFYVLTYVYFYHNTDKIRHILKVCMVGTTLAMLYVVARHIGLGLTFDSINKAATPIFRNHVAYSALLVLTVPYVVYLWRSSQFALKNVAYPILLSFMLFATYTTYTRAAYLSILAVAAGYFMFKFRLTRLAIVVSLLCAIGGITYMVNDNTYLEYAPNYERTIAHYNFENLIEATYKMEDVSSMERVYRWVAGVRMFGEKPLLGFGPGSFYESYVPYTVSSFQTYVSDNPEHSGIHNYFLMIAVEQGILGLLLIIVLTFLPLYMAERCYHFAQKPNDKLLALTAGLSLLAIDVLLLINDLIETDKVGPYYFFNIAVIAIIYMKNTKVLSEQKH